jgi:hypothetical protein
MSVTITVYIKQMFNAIFIARFRPQLVSANFKGALCSCVCVDCVLMHNEVVVFVSRLFNYVCIVCYTWRTHNWGKSRPKIVGSDNEEATF